MWARLAHQGRQELAAPKVRAGQQKQIVETTLVLSSFLLLVVLNLVAAQRVNHLALPPRLQKLFAPDTPKRFSLNQLLFEGMLLFGQDRPAENVKVQFRGTDANFELRLPSSRDTLHFAMCVFDLPPQHRHPMIRFLEPQLALPFQALPHPQKGFERESECHEG
jgi:hypothetical protein